MFASSCYALNRDQRAHLTPAETTVDYLPFAKVLYEQKSVFKRFGVGMEALYYHGIKRTKVCPLNFRREDSRNYLNGTILERWFCFKFALSVLLPMQGIVNILENA